MIGLTRTPCIKGQNLVRFECGMYMTTGKDRIRSVLVSADAILWPGTEAGTQKYTQQACKRARLSNDYNDHVDTIGCGMVPGSRRLGRHGTSGRASYEAV